jgi:hypothetical protein
VRMFSNRLGLSAAVAVVFDHGSAEAQSHGHAGNAVVLHFQTSSPDEVEVLELSTAGGGMG